MSITLDRTTRELSTTCLKLAEGLRFSPQVHGHETCYHIEDSPRGKFYRVGYSEYVFISLLDGSRTVAQTLTITARMLGSRALTQQRGIQVADWLLEHGLAQICDGTSTSQPNVSKTSGPSAVLKRLNPFWMRFALGCPDRGLAALLPAFGWLFSIWATAAGLALITVGIGCIVSHWSSFLASAATVLTPHNWLWMLVAWLLLKVIHELSHALACKYHGGEVREVGLIFILFAPMAYVDVTSCWRFPSRWQRIHVAAAGIYAELVVAALSAIAWCNIESPLAHHLLFNVIVMASFSTLLFNANPLMRFDGYYIFADLVGIPNLANEGQRFIGAITRRLFFGDKSSPLQTRGARRWIAGCYGVASTAWRILICISLVTAASVLFHGAGLLLAIIGVVAWFGVPLWSLGCKLQRRYLEHRSSFIRAVATGAALGSISLAILLWVPWPGTLTAPTLVEYSDISLVRCGAPGFVRHVHVDDGEAVERGQLLVELENQELSGAQRELELSYEQELVKRRVALEQRDGATAQISAENLRAIQERLIETRRRNERLRICAPIAGRVVARELNQKVGTYLKDGDEILAVSNENSKELIVSVGQEAIDTIIPYVGKATRFRINGRRARKGILSRLSPRATTALPHPAMSSSAGGPLTVTSQSANNGESVRVAEPRFRGVITLSSSVCRDLGAGEQGYAILGARKESVGQFIWLRFHRWCESLLRPLQVRTSR